MIVFLADTIVKLEPSEHQNIIICTGSYNIFRYSSLQENIFRYVCYCYLDTATLKTDRVQFVKCAASHINHQQVFILTHLPSLICYKPVNQNVHSPDVKINQKNAI